MSEKQDNETNYVKNCSVANHTTDIKICNGCCAYLKFCKAINKKRELVNEKYISIAYLHTEYHTMAKKTDKTKRNTK